MPLQTQTYTDLDFNFIANPMTGDVSTVDNIAAIKRSIYNLVMTNNYERLEQPEIGCTLSHLLFQQMDPITTNQIQTSITAVLQKFEPRCQLFAVYVAANYDANSYLVQVVFGVKNLTMDPVTFSFILSRVR